MSGTAAKNFFPNIRKGLTGLFERVRPMLEFNPKDPQGGYQILPPMTKNSPVDRIKGFRYPSPGSIHGARIPIRDTSDDVYDIKQYTRDPRNMQADSETFINSAQPALLAPKVAPVGSPGTFKNAAVLQYDPSGLRSSMSATWGALDKAVEQRTAPNHLPMPAWWNDLKEIEADCERKGIPYVPGRRVKMTAGTNYNEVRW